MPLPGKPPPANWSMVRLRASPSPPESRETRSLPDARDRRGPVHSVHHGHGQMPTHGPATGGIDNYRQPNEQGSERNAERRGPHSSDAAEEQPSPNICVTIVNLAF